MISPALAAILNQQGAAATGDPNYFTGGVVTVADGYRYHTFNSSGTLTFVDADGLGTAVDVDYLVVAGGGGGAVTDGAGGGGGAGGVLIASAYALAATQAVTIGAGGSGGTTDAAGQTSGSTSSLGAIASATGGGFGANDARGAGGTGGSGGAGETGGAGTSGQGFAGAAILNNSFGGGGGGASEVGSASDGSSIPADGGDGIQWPTGSGTYYGGGGGGSDRVGAAAVGSGGLGGGGNSTKTSNTSGSAGSANTGGGGGAGRLYGGATGGAGGSGVVIVRYPDDPSFGILSQSEEWWVAADVSGASLPGRNGVSDGTIGGGAARSDDGTHYTLPLNTGNLALAQYVQFADGTLFRPGTGEAFTAVLVGAVNNGTGTLTRWVVSNRLAGNDGWQVYLSTSSNSIGAVDTGPLTENTVKAPPATTRQTYVVGRNDAGNIFTRYSSDAISTGAAATGSLQGNSDALFVGRSPAGAGTYSDVTLYGLAYFRKALTATEIDDVVTALLAADEV